MTQYYGKYRATVVSTADPEQRGRVKVKCPKVLGTARSAWCEACIPVANEDYGDIAVPRIGDVVWVEFESGDLRYPIYSGSWYSLNSTPLSSYSNVTTTRILSYRGVYISMSSTSCLIIRGSSRITLTDSAITLQSNGISCVLNATTLTALKALIGG